MRHNVDGRTVRLWLSAQDTYEWATRIGECWPCSSLSGHRLFAEFDSNGLLDFTVDGRDAGNRDIDGQEFNAITSDYLRPVLSKDHPAYCVTVGQFEEQ